MAGLPAAVAPAPTQEQLRTAALACIAICVQESELMAAVLEIGINLKAQRAARLIDEGKKMAAEWEGTTDGALAEGQWKQYFAHGRKIRDANVAGEGQQTEGRLPSRRVLDLFGGDKRPLMADEGRPEGSLSEEFRELAGYTLKQTVERAPYFQRVLEKWAGHSLYQSNPKVTFDDLEQCAFKAFKEYGLSDKCVFWLHR